MKHEIVEEIAKEMKIKISQVEVTLKLLEDGNTIPFIARYRKEATGVLDEEQIRKISEVYEYEVNLLKRKEDVIRLIEEKGLLTDELRQKIMDCTKLVEVEDLYRPFKEKKKTKATEAIKAGLEPLAKKIMEFPKDGSIEALAKPFVNDIIDSAEKAIEGAKYIIAENISDEARFRTWIRKYTKSYGKLKTKLKKGSQDENKVYDMYYSYEESIKEIKPHRILAINRGEKEGILSTSFDIDKDTILQYIESIVIGKKESFVVDTVKQAIEDSYKRLIAPNIEREIRSEITLDSSEVAIKVFAENLENLLLQPPMKEKVVLALDPAFRTGCKLAVLDSTGKYLDISVIYPHEPKNEKEKSKKQVLDLIHKYSVDIIAIGNGTASRESEAFISEVIKEAKRKVEYIIVSEAGASVYSASKLAINEFPNLHVEERSAISIGRRLQDPLAELVKIDPKSIGVGQYQHDVPEKRLEESLNFVVSKAVNKVGVNINTASSELLKYVSGMNKRSIDKLLEYRDAKGKICSREELKKKKILGDKTFEQAAGFIRVENGDNMLDRTGIHPESYDVAKKIMGMYSISIDEIGKDGVKSKLKNLNIEEIAKELETDKYTIEDVLKSIELPSRDPRDEYDRPLLKSDILTIDNLKVGMKLQGTVRNVVDFGAFIDIGLKNDGLAHISKLTNRYIKHPNEVVSVGDIVDCYVDEIKLDKKKVALSLINPEI